jgi:hypothetical protein
MTAKERTTKSADAVILDVLVYEFPFHDRTEAERKVKRRLRYRGLGPYRQERVDLLRRFKDAIQSEIHRGARSRYYAGRHGQYAAMEDFDFERMTEDFRQSYPDVHHEEIKRFLPCAVYLYYLR